MTRQAMERETVAPDIEVIRANILEAMDAHGFSWRSLSAAAGLTESAVRDLMRRTNNPGVMTLFRIAAPLKLTIPQAVGVERLSPQDAPEKCP